MHLLKIKPWSIVSVTFKGQIYPAVVFDNIDGNDITRLWAHLTLPNSPGLCDGLPSPGRWQGQRRGIPGGEQRMRPLRELEFRQDMSQNLQESGLFFVHRDDPAQAAAAPTKGFNDV